MRTTSFSLEVREVLDDFNSEERSRNFSVAEIDNLMTQASLTL